MSNNRNKQNREYSRLRKQFLMDHPNCHARMPGCLLRANQIHHMRGRIGELYLDTKDWVALCSVCHTVIELNPVMAKELGFSKSRLHK